MQKRLHMQAIWFSIFVEDEASPDGLKRLKDIRRTDSRFRRARIKEVLQAYPDRILLGKKFVTASDPPLEVI